jgi:predicted phosphodiesterase
VANQEHAAGQNRAPQELAAAVFLGDGWEDLDAASAQTGFAVPWYKVRGNGDLNLSIPHSLVLDVSVPKGNSPGTSRKLFLAHGNRYGVGEGGQTIAAAARAAGAEAALFGHTHNPHCSVLDGLFLLNPGSIGRSRSNAGPTFAVLECPAAGPLGARFFRLVKQDRKFAVEELEL